MTTRVSIQIITDKIDDDDQKQNCVGVSRLGFVFKHTVFKRSLFPEGLETSLKLFQHPLPRMKHTENVEPIRCPN